MISVSRRRCRIPNNSGLIIWTGLISQVAEELWEVKGRKIKNLTRDDITIVDYKKMLVKNSECLPPLYDGNAVIDVGVRYRSSGTGEGEAVQQDCEPHKDLGGGGGVSIEVSGVSIQYVHTYSHEQKHAHVSVFHTSCSRIITS